MVGRPRRGSGDPPPIPAKESEEGHISTNLGDRAEDPENQMLPAHQLVGLDYAISVLIHTVKPVAELVVGGHGRAQASSEACRQAEFYRWSTPVTATLKPLTRGHLGSTPDVQLSGIVTVYSLVTLTYSLVPYPLRPSVRQFPRGQDCPSLWGQPSEH